MDEQNNYSRAEVLARLEARANSRHSDRWQDTVDIGVLLSDMPKRSPLRKQTMAEITERCMMKPATISQCLSIYRTCIEGQEQPFVPTRLHFSTALHMSQKGASLADFIHADEEGMTLSQVRAWLADRATVREKKARSFWRTLTQAVDEDIRKTTEPLTDEQVTRLVMQVRATAKEWGNETH